ILLLSCYPYFVYCPSGSHRCLHSFPTRRSSDLRLAEQGRYGAVQGMDAAQGHQRHRQGQPADIEQQRLEGRVPPGSVGRRGRWRSEEHTSELQSRENLVCRLLLEKKKTTDIDYS